MDIISWKQAKKAYDKAESVEKQLEEAAEEDLPDEVEKARVDTDGNKHETLKKRLESEYESNKDRTKKNKEDLRKHKDDKDNPHSVNKEDIGLGKVDNAKQATKEEAEEIKESLESHENDEDNPHKVTKKDVGLGYVSNREQASKEEFNDLTEDFDSHKKDTDNPHNVTKEDVELENVKNIEQASMSDLTSHIEDFEELKDEFNDFKEKAEDKSSHKKFSDLEEPIYICHRGGSNIFPENTMEAYEGCIALGNRVIETDIRVLSDKSLAVFHDAKVDNLTNKKGKAVDFSTMGWRNLELDPPDLVWNRKETPTLFESVLSRFGKNAIYIPEAKEEETGKPIVETLKRYNLEDYALVQSFHIDALDEAIEEGIPSMYVTKGDDPDGEDDPVKVKEKGVKYIGVSRKADDDYITSCLDEGLKVIIWTVNMRHERDKFLDLGVHGFFSDDPFYLEGKMDGLNKDPFNNEVHYHGHVPSKRNVDGDLKGMSDRGSYKNGRFGWFDTTGDTTRDFVLQGWADELPEEFTLEFDVEYEEATGWGSVVLCSPKDYFDDDGSEDSNGYHILFTAAGNVTVFRIDEGEADRLDIMKFDSKSDGDSYKIKIEVTSKDIKVTEENEKESITVQDDEYRNGYMLIGRKEAAVTFGNMEFS